MHEHQISLERDVERAMEEDKVIPVGYRFYPTEEELLSFFLKEILQGNRDHPLVQKIERIIPVLDIYEQNPWDLPKLSGETCRGDPQQEEWFFFIPGQEKEVRGGKPNRLTSTGYWKATGSRSSVYSNVNRHRVIGSKMTMVFYRGRAPGIKTQWKMNEYRAVDDRNSGTNPIISTSSSTDGNPKTRVEFSVCRVYVTSKCLRAFDRRPPLLPSSTSSAAASMNKAPVISLLDHPHDVDDQVRFTSDGRGSDPLSDQDGTAKDDISLMDVEETPAEAKCDKKVVEIVHRHNDDRDRQDDLNMRGFINMATMHDAPLWECENNMYDDILLNLDLKGHELF